MDGVMNAWGLRLFYTFTLVFGVGSLGWKRID